MAIIFHNERWRSRKGEGKGVRERRRGERDRKGERRKRERCSQTTARNSCAVSGGN